MVKDRYLSAMIQGLVARNPDLFSMESPVPVKPNRTDEEPVPDLRPYRNKQKDPILKPRREKR